MNPRCLPLHAVLAAVTLLAFPGCSSRQTPTAAPAPAAPQDAAPPLVRDGDLVQSPRERDIDPPTSPDQLDQLVRSNRQFAFTLHHRLRLDQPEGNLFHSPHSISAALAMTYAGARDDTARQIERAMNFPYQRDTLHAAFNALDLRLQPEPDGPGATDEEGGQPLEFTIANALWIQGDHPFLRSFFDTLARHYGAGAHLVDFRTDPDATREYINARVEEQTRGRVADLLPEDSVREGTRLVLTNAIYFKAGWLRPFDEQRTLEQDFHRIDRPVSVVPIMRQSHDFRYAAVDGHQIVELPYAGVEFAMIVILPSRGQFEILERRLDEPMFARFLDNLHDAYGTIGLPRFKVDSQFSLRRALSGMGMPHAFDRRRADFSGIDGTRLLYIHDAYHRSFLTVDELGTEAAAATGAVIGLEAAPTETFEMICDRPFLFAIIHRPTGAMLFFGSVRDP